MQKNERRRNAGVSFICTYLLFNSQNSNHMVLSDLLCMLRAFVSRGRIRIFVTRTLSMAGLLGMAFMMYACQGQPQPQPRLTGKPIDEVLKENTPHLMTITGVVGTAIGECNHTPCIKVLVEKKTPIIMQQIPSMLETWQVEIVESGATKPF